MSGMISGALRGRIRGITRRYRNLKFRTKLLISYALLISIPLTAVTVIARLSIAHYMEKQVVYSSMQAFQQTDSFLTYKLNTIINASDVIYYDTRVQEILSFGEGKYKNDIGLLNRDMNNLITTLFGVIQSNEDIYHIRLYVSNDFIFSPGNFYFLPFEDAMRQDFYRKMQERKDKVIWTAPEALELPRRANQLVISMVRGIRNNARLGEFIALLRIDIPESTISDIIGKANMTDGSYTCIVNSDNEIIAGAGVSPRGIHAPGKTVLDWPVGNHAGWTPFSANGGKFIAGSTAIAGTDWTLVSVVPYRYIQSASIGVRNEVILIAIIVGFAAYVIAWFGAASGVKRINALALSMRKVQEGNFGVVAISDIRDEIGELEENFNYMVKTLSSMIAERVQSGQEMKAAELKALQAQINPHFLYNTLDLINWMALRSGIPSISGLVQSLAMFYKLSLGSGNDMAPLREEIAHVKVYLEIQAVRFDNKIQYSFSIDDAITECPVPKIILQPLVENSIIHGILEKPDKTGTILVSGQRNNNNIILSVTDDGVGMDSGITETIVTKGTDRYGVFNIDQRIKLYYGDQYGLSYRSAPAQGTTATITLPYPN